MDPPPSHITLLDGSIGHALKLSGAIPADAGFLAVARLAATGRDGRAPIAALAAAYAAAGCTVLTAPNFGVTPVGLAAAGLPDSDLEPLTAACVAAVREGVAAGDAAAAAAPAAPGGGGGGAGAAPRVPVRRRRVAGCLPPLGPDCYAPAPRGVAATAAKVHARIARALLKSGADLLLAETVSASADAAAALAGARAAVAAAVEEEGEGAAGEGGGGDAGGAASPSTSSLPLPVPVWIAWTLDDAAWPPRLRGGEYLADAAASLAAAEAVMNEGQQGGGGPRLVAVQAHLVNCSTPSAVAAGIAVLRGAVPATVAVGGYANGFARPTSEWLAGGRRGGGRDGGGGGAGGLGAATASGDYGPDGLITPGAYAEHASRWVDEAGASVVGGCCGVGPAHLAAVRGRLGVV